MAVGMLMMIMMVIINVLCLKLLKYVLKEISISATQTYNRQDLMMMVMVIRMDNGKWCEYEWIHDISTITREETKSNQTSKELATYKIIMCERKKDSESHFIIHST